MFKLRHCFLKVALLSMAFSLTACSKSVKDENYFLKHPEAIHDTFEMCHHLQGEAYLDNLECKASAKVLREIGKVQAKLFSASHEFGRDIIQAQMALIQLKAAGKSGSDQALNLRRKINLYYATISYTDSKRH